MGFLIVGLVLLAMKVAEIDPVAGWSWLWVLLPFGAAVAWWSFADSTGLTQRRAMRKMDERKEERRQRSMEQLGLGTRRDPKRSGSREAPAARAPAAVRDPVSAAADARVQEVAAAERKEPRL